MKLLFTCLSQKLSFSSFTKTELETLGVRRGRLVFKQTAMHDLATKTTSQAAAEVEALRARIIDIYDLVNMDVSLFPKRSYILL